MVDPRPRARPVTLAAWIVVDLGFGDAGKGSVTDFLVRDHGASLVVRHGGGAQAGHTVVTVAGPHHTFSQLGAGTFVPGVGTHLGPAFLLHPGGLLQEVARLAMVGVPDALARLTVDQRATVITPFQQAAGRLRELQRGAAAHGTCGVGVGEARGDRLHRHDDTLVAGDLRNLAALREPLARQQARKRDELRAALDLDDPRAAPEALLLRDPTAVARTLEQWAPLQRALTVLDPGAGRCRIAAAGTVVFEGAQGVLLDQTHGFRPHTTWCDCTATPARALLAGLDAAVVTLGVTRAFMIRHGPGPLPTEDRVLDEPHQDTAGWQGPVRGGPLDLVLLRHALARLGGLDGLAVTHLDRVPDPVPVCSRYAGGRPRIEPVPRRRLLDHIARTLGVPVWLQSQGPTAADKRWGPGWSPG
jgi:adenylosuccinate synthase